MASQRIFILGPSHHHYLTRCALSQCTSYETPLGNLDLDLDIIRDLQKTGHFDRMSQAVDEAEHSIEMHLPYIYKILCSISSCTVQLIASSRTLSENATHLPPIIPILVGNTSPAAERVYGGLFAPYLADPTSLFIISSDFAHWGSRFSYTYYEPANGGSVGCGYSLKSSDTAPTNPPIYESIAKVDMHCINAVESGRHEAFLQALSETGNTVCGRHPIGIIMAALEVLRAQGHPEEGRFRFVRYERSSDCKSVRDSSVSYASGFAVV